MNPVERILEKATAKHFRIADPERRTKPRLHEDFRGTVEVDSVGQPVQQDCVIENISASGLYIRGEGNFVRDAQLKVVVQLFIEGQTGSTVETVGRVVRVEPWPDGGQGVALEISRHRFL